MREHRETGALLLYIYACDRNIEGNSAHIPVYYKDMFGNGTKPSEWKTEVPFLQKLMAHLESQAQRIRELPAELFALTLYHEADHLG